MAAFSPINESDGGGTLPSFEIDRLENLQQQAMKLGDALYKNTSLPGGAGPEPEAQSDRGTTEGAAAGGAKKDDDVIDAEYEVKE